MYAALCDINYICVAESVIDTGRKKRLQCRKSGPQAIQFEDCAMHG